jgi:hypothetical protein
MNIPAGYIELRRVLYGPKGLFPDVCAADVAQLFPRRIRRYSKPQHFRHDFVHQADVEKVRRRLAAQARRLAADLAELVG